MKIKEIYYTRVFEKGLKKLSGELKQLIKKRVILFRENPFSQQLKTHKLTGKFKDYYSFSLTYSHRVIFKFKERDVVLFYEVGGHEIYK